LGKVTVATEIDLFKHSVQHHSNWAFWHWYKYMYKIYTLCLKITVAFLI